MRPETKKRLDHLIFMERLKKGLTVTGTVLLLSIIAFFIGYEKDIHTDKVTKTHLVHGVIIQSTPKIGRRSFFTLSVKLDDGHTIQTISTLSASILKNGNQLELKEIMHQSGRKTYTVTKGLKSHS